HAADLQRAEPAEGPAGNRDPAVQVVVDLPDDERAHRTGAGNGRTEDDEQNQHEHDRDDHPRPATPSLARRRWWRRLLLLDEVIRQGGINRGIRGVLRHVSLAGWLASARA